MQEMGRARRRDKSAPGLGKEKIGRVPDHALGRFKGGAAGDRLNVKSLRQQSHQSRPADKTGSAGKKNRAHSLAHSA
jgi:hypothetical protein